MSIAQSLKPPENFETTRLLLRPVRFSDAPFIFSYASDPAVARFVTWPVAADLSETENYTRGSETNWSQGISYDWLISTKDDLLPHGVVTIVPESTSVQIGFALAKKSWGRGYTAEASQTIVDWLKLQPKIYRIWTVGDADNIGSARVLEKIGMQREGILRNWKIRPNINSEVPRDCYCYSLIKDG